MNDCMFCKIIDKEIPSKIVFENDKLLAFHDIYPAAPIHILIAPKTHIQSMANINEGNASIIADIHLVAIKLATQFGILDSGFRLINNCGKDGCQSVMHLHYHLIGGKHLGTNILGTAN